MRPLLEGVEFFGEISSNQRQILVDLGDRFLMMVVMLAVDDQRERIDSLKLRETKVIVGFFQQLELKPKFLLAFNDDKNHQGFTHKEDRSHSMVVQCHEVAEVR